MRNRLRSTVYGKYAAVLLVLFSSIALLYIVLTMITTRMYLQEVNQKLNRPLAKDLVTNRLLSKQGDVNQEALKEIFHMFMVVNPSIEIYLLDADGTIRTFSAPADKVKRTSISLEPVKHFLSGAAVLPILGDDPRDVNRHKVFSVSPIPAEGPPEGYLYIVLGGEDYDSAVAMLQGSYILRLSLWAALTGLLFALLSGLLLFHMLTRRVRQLASSMETFAESGFSSPVQVPLRSVPRDGEDEIDRLGITFNQMVERILTQVTKLKHTDALRRELIANVSHDLRTPLASLHGYLETLLIKEGNLSADEQRSFLAIATKQSERLRHLVEELFELAKLDSSEVKLHCEPFSLAELVQDVVQKFHLAAEKQRVKLETAFVADLPFVLADIGLIERVLDNLLQNALRYTPPGGTITVAIAQAEQSVVVRIADTGCGIAAEDLPYIFDRFYRADGRRRSEGAGLGLAITKRILELHGSAVQAQSTLDAGTAIVFQLPTCAS